VRPRKGQDAVNFASDESFSIETRQEKTTDSKWVIYMETLAIVCRPGMATTRLAVRVDYVRLRQLHQTQTTFNHIRCMRNLRFPNVQTGHQPHTVLPSGQEQ
jgi:hypothetical protein